MNEIVLRHHREQKLIAQNVIAQLHPLWRILDFHNLHDTTGDWLKVVSPVIEQGHLTSQYVAARFVNSYRSSLFPAAPTISLEVPNPLGLFGTSMIPDRKTRVRVMVSMKVTGPVWLVQNSFPNMTELDQAELMERGFSKSSGAAIRLVLNGGRGLVRLAADADPMAKGVVGVADEDSCDSCQFLTKPILKTAGARKMDAISVGHDFCKCSASLIY